jgi:hypothetical protein
MTTAKTFRVTHYLNDKITRSITGLTIQEAYNEAVPQEAFKSSVSNRWHVMMYSFACEKMKELEMDSPLLVAWEETSAEKPSLACRHAIIFRDDAISQ